MRNFVAAVFLLAIFPCVSMAQEARNPKIFWNKQTDEKVIAITIDDCNNPKRVEAMLEIAERHGIKLTFFPIGANVLSQQDLWRRIYELGHGIELHTQNHRNMNTSEEVQLREASQNIASLRKVLGEEKSFSYLRPPFGDGIGKKNQPRIFGALKKASELNGKPIDIAMWTTDLTFLKGKLTTPAQIKDIFLGNLKPGNIFLFHARKEDLVYFEEIVIGTKEAGFEMVTLSDLMQRSSHRDKIAKIQGGDK